VPRRFRFFTFWPLSWNRERYRLSIARRLVPTFRKQRKKIIYFRPELLRYFRYRFTSFLPGLSSRRIVFLSYRGTAPLPRMMDVFRHYCWHSYHYYRTFMDRWSTPLLLERRFAYFEEFTKPFLREFLDSIGDYYIRYSRHAPIPRGDPYRLASKFLDILAIPEEEKPVRRF
jgi:hypothetical protein